MKTLMDACPDEEAAYLLLEDLRWHGEPVCPFCGNEKAYFLMPSNGKTRATGPKKTMSVRRVWKCSKCRRQFSVLTNTVMHATKVPIRTWLAVLVQVSSAKNGISAREVERMHGITAETAWHMLHRIREAMRRDPLVGMLNGTIEVDETFLGGDPKNRHGYRRQAIARREGLARLEPAYLNPPIPKTPVVSLVDRETGEVRSQVMRNVTGANIGRVIAENVAPTSSLVTDQATHYLAPGSRLASHESVNHSRGEYVRGAVSTNRIEGFFSQLKRSIDGTYHRVSVEHLQRYLDEFDFRYSTRKLSDSDRALRIIEQGAGRRLTYRPSA
jgi:transposase-like protein